MTAPNDDFGAWLDGQSITDDLIAAAYESASAERLRPTLLVEYRCRGQGCLLWRVWRSPRGMCFYLPGYKLSSARTDAETVETARAKRTSDGYRKWRGRGGLLDRLRDWPPEVVGMLFQCDHTKVHRRADQLIADAEAATPGKPTRRHLPE